MSTILHIHSRSYDLTAYLPLHPGGAAVIAALASSPDATAEYDAAHGSDPTILSDVARPYLLPAAAPFSPSASVHHQASSAAPSPGTHSDVPRLTPPEARALQNVAQIAARALDAMPPALLRGYINYGSEDEISLRNNETAWSRYTLRPRV